MRLRGIDDDHRRVGSGRRALLVGLMAALALAVGACGGDDGGDEAATTDTGASETAYQASESVEEFEARLEGAMTALQDADCQEVGEFFAFSFLGLPCEEQVAGDFGEFEITGSEEFGGTAAVVDFEAKAGPGTVIATVGTFGLLEPTAVLGAPAGNVVGTELTDEEARSRDLQLYIQSRIDQDCDQYFQYALTQTDNKEQECERVFEGGEQAREELNAADGDPELIGGNEFVSFYTLSSSDPTSHRVLFTIPDDEDPHFISVSSRIGPPADSAAEVERSTIAPLVAELNNTIGPAASQFIAEIEPAAANGALAKMRSLSSSFRDPLFAWDAQLREADLPDALATEVNAVLDAVGPLIETLDGITTAGTADEAADLVPTALEQEAQLKEAIDELYTALGR